MPLRIANNISSMNTQRWLGVADSGMKRSLERLSSGYRINKAADDAAGLAISQQFRADIASFKVASRNTSEAAALLQVAEGGMDQIGNMLTRLKELATQASSANVGSAERAKIDAEGAQLLTEIDRIANSSKYGSTTLLDGTFGASKTGAQAVLTSYGTSAVQGIVDDANDNIAYYGSYSNEAMSGTVVNAVGSGITEDTAWRIYIISGGGDEGKALLANGTISSGGSATVKETSAATLATGVASFANVGLTITFTNTTLADIGTAVAVCSGVDGSTAGSGFQLTFKRTGLTSLNVESATSGTYTFSSGAGANEMRLGNGTSTETISYGGAGSYNFSTLGITFTLGSDYDDDDLENSTITVTSSGSAGSTFQIGAENNTDNRISITVDGARQSDLGLSTLDLSTSSNAQAALDLVDTAISSLTSTRGDVGAYMNRLSYAAANLATTIENVQAAESVIRDVDMAAEMTEFTKNQILLQAGTAMLAQANMAPQQVLSLFG